MNKGIELYLLAVHTPKEQKILPSEKFELTAHSLGAHIETHTGLILRTLS